ncbi:MAG: hypothetical protein ACRDKX_03770 [Solirubrobacterales bacterium]
MNRQQILERERRWAKPAAAAAILAVPLYVGSVIADQAGPVPTSGLDTERYPLIDANMTELLGSVVLRGLAFGLLCVPLLYLFRAAQARSDRVATPMLGFVFIGPVLLAAQGVVAWIAQGQVASDFVAQAGPGGDIYTLLDDLVEDSASFDVAANLLFPAILGMVVAMVYVPLQAMRVGLVTRFFGTLGMALGAALIFIVPAVSLLTIVLWFLFLGLIILDRAPGGRPPAWAAGEAIPWPRPGEEEPDPRTADDPAAPGGEAEEAAGSDSATELAAGAEPKDHSARRERTRKRKRKQRRR